MKAFTVYIQFVGGVWRIGWIDAFRLKGHGFDHRSSRHVVTLGKSLTHNLSVESRAH